MNKIAYTAFIAFLATILTLLSASALSQSSDEARDDEALDAITWDELAEHDGAESCWKAIYGRVYDVTDFIPVHPTEEEVMLEWCGRDATEGWENKRPGVPHSPRAESRLESLLVGRLVGEDGQPVMRDDAADMGAEVIDADRALSPAEDERLHRAMLGMPLDGHYRGVFTDRGVIQVNITFDLRDGRFDSVDYRHLAYRGVDYLALEEGDEGYPVRVQYEQVAERLEGEPVTRIFALYEPERMVDDVDGYSGATLRGAKVISAIRDGLNRGVYSWP
ncbi:cytochrome b5 domain-containing protein [Billgrantia montanilacus]|uniref:Cytochrome b5 domain-containing protein n=1 Tax=Billgrantia montanilacus TaxID=2282305 RepID=A0A368U310_9GAMM|nr:cytochrome b5-like heme/steroid binding domain-containing protein [Halomonas montanilacus]RCV91500.1 cytochrome b5 domain-containing protein [Halomonas montanilacus]